MRKTAILCAALAMAALSLTSCQKEENANNQKFFATFEHAGNDKVSLDTNLNMYWKDDLGSSMIGVMTVDGENQPDLLTTYYPSSISADGKTAVLEYTDIYSYPPFEEGTQGPFYAMTNNIGWSSTEVNDDGSMNYLVYQDPFITSCVMPMVASADDFGQLQFKHIAGVLKMNVTLPEGYAVNNVWVTNVYAISGYFCDVVWDAQGDITVSNVVPQSNWSSSLDAIKGNGFFYLPMPVGNWTGLEFWVEATTADGFCVNFRKAMSYTASIDIERAGISTVTLNYTVDDIS